MGCLLCPPARARPFCPAVSVPRGFFRRPAPSVGTMRLNRHSMVWWRALCVRACAEAPRVTGSLSAGHFVASRNHPAADRIRLRRVSWPWTRLFAPLSRGFFCGRNNPARVAFNRWRATVSTDALYGAPPSCHAQGAPLAPLEPPSPGRTARGFFVGPGIAPSSPRATRRKSLIQGRG